MLDNIILELEKITNETQRFIVSENKNILFKITNNNLSKIEESENNFVKIDLIENKRRVNKVVSAKNIQFIKENIEKMRAKAKFKDRLFFDKFPKTKEFNFDKILDENILSINKDDLETLIPKYLEFSSDLKENKLIENLEIEFNFNIKKKTYISKEGTFEDIDLNLGTYVEATNKGDEESSHYISREFYTLDEFNLDKLRNDFLEKIEFERNPKFDPSINSKEYDLVFPPETLSSVLENFIIKESSVERVVKKDSYLIDAKFNDKLNIYEDPNVPYSFYSNIRDSDFVLTTKKYFIKQGKFKDYICSEDEAYKYKKESTGNTLSSNATNIFVDAGEESYLDLIKRTKKGLIIIGLLGMHTTNSREGAFNLTCSLAIEVEDGKIKRSLKNIPINESIVDIFTNCELSLERSRDSNYTLPSLVFRR